MAAIWHDMVDYICYIVKLVLFRIIHFLFINMLLLSKHMCDLQKWFSDEKIKRLPLTHDFEFGTAKNSLPIRC